MIRNILAASTLAAVVALAPGLSSAQVSCEEYMATIQEKLDQVADDKKAKAMEHFAAAQQAMGENNEERCIEELQLANQEIEAL
jgi:hypothetical protein